MPKWQYVHDNRRFDGCRQPIKCLRVFTFCAALRPGHYSRAPVRVRVCCADGPGLHWTRRPRPAPRLMRVGRVLSPAPPAHWGAPAQGGHKAEVENTAAHGHLLLSGLFGVSCVLLRVGLARLRRSQHCKRARHRSRISSTPLRERRACRKKPVARGHNLLLYVCLFLRAVFHGVQFDAFVHQGT